MLLRFDPFREFERATESLSNAAWGRNPVVPMDAVRRGNHVVVTFDLPGADADSIELTVERNVLSLKAERRPTRAEDDEVIASERRYGTFARQLLLGDTLDSGSVRADYDNGVLTVTIPVAETAKPRRVEIGGGHDEARAIETESDTAPAS